MPWPTPLARMNLDFIIAEAQLVGRVDVVTWALVCRDTHPEVMPELSILNVLDHEQWIDLALAHVLEGDFDAAIPALEHAGAGGNGESKPDLLARSFEAILARIKRKEEARKKLVKRIESYLPKRTKKPTP